MRFTAARSLTLLLFALVACQPAAGQAQDSQADNPKKLIRVGIIGLDTSHVPAFTKEMNNAKADSPVAGCKVVAAYPKGSPDIESSVRRVPMYTAAVKELGVEIVDSIPALIEKVDAVLLETNDGRPHLEQVLPVLRAGKPVFIDKPVAGSLADAIAIYRASKKYKAPVFSSSSLRYAEHAAELRGGKIGKVLGAHTFSPCHLEATHPDLYWYGIHGVELLYTVMGTGCETVTRASSDDFDVVTGTWADGRIGVFRGIRKGGGGYGGTVFGERGVHAVGPYRGYKPLVAEIVKFFKTGKPPVSEKETLELYTFMAAADESKRRGGAPASIKTVFEAAAHRATGRLQELDGD